MRRGSATSWSKKRGTVADLRDDHCTAVRAFEQHELPVAHQTRRTGRPYRLVLTKREALFERDAARRKQWLEDLEWLKRALS